MSSSPVEAPAKVVRFGLFEFDLESNELRRKGLRLKLQDQQLNLLRILLEHPGTLVTRDELRHRLWKPGTFVEFDHSLNTAMMRLREVLGDSSDNPMLIETVPRKGYRFIAPVHDWKKERETPDPLTPIDAKVEKVEDELNLAVTPPQYHSSIAVPSPLVPLVRQVSLRRAVLAGLALTLFIVAVLFLFRQNLGLISSDTKQISSIAVLPMENLSGDKPRPDQLVKSDLSHYGDGIQGNPRIPGKDCSRPSRRRRR
jgi:DNA-binding winged helix-turn-helix (wHTH) protein